MKNISENNSPQGESVRTGTQSIERVLGLLRIVASRGRQGIRIGELTQTAQLPQSTCFRMLQRLELEGVIDRDPQTRKYYLGPLLYELGLLARPRYRLSELCDASLQQLAELTQDTVYLSERSGLEAVCTNRALGDYPVKSLTLDIGIRRPIGVGAGGLAMLCVMTEADAEALIKANGHRYENFGHLHPDDLRRAVAEGRRCGYAYLDSVVAPGAAAMGVAFPPENPVAAISVAALSVRLEPARRAEIARELHRHVRKVSAVMAATNFAGAQEQRVAP